MSVTGWIQIVVLVAALTLLTPMLGGYMARVHQRERIGLSYVPGPLERPLYRALRVDAEDEQRWVQYAGSLLLFSAASWLALYVILRTQRVDPFNPQGFVHSGPWDLSFNNAAGLHTHVVAGSAGGNMEGEEQRFGPAGSALFVASGTASGDGAVNSGVESYTGLGAGVAMANMMTGEVIFGGPTPGLSNPLPATSVRTGSPLRISRVA